MSAPVDVLAVMAPGADKIVTSAAWRLVAEQQGDRLYAVEICAVNSTPRTALIDADELEDARAAVAELIAAASPFATFSGSEPTIKVHTPGIARLRSALARIGDAE